MPATSFQVNRRRLTLSPGISCVVTGGGLRIRLTGARARSDGRACSGRGGSGLRRGRRLLRAADVRHGRPAGRRRARKRRSRPQRDSQLRDSSFRLTESRSTSPPLMFARLAPRSDLPIALGILAASGVVLRRDVNRSRADRRAVARRLDSSTPEECCQLPPPPGATD